MLSSRAAGALWQAQDALHGKSRAALPACMLAAACALVIYRHATETEQGHDPLKTFLALIVVQMLPLVFLEIKMLDCPDPAGMLSRFGAKVLLMHACFLALRVFAHPYTEVGTGLCNLVSLLGACAALHMGFGFRWSAAGLRKHCDVCLLAVAAAAAACITCLVGDDINDLPYVELVIATASDYIELLAFVPAVWMVQRSDKDVVQEWSGSPDPQKQAVAFFLFLVALYSAEDGVSALRLWGDLPLAAAAHLAHLLLVLDVACFLLAHFCNPEKLKGGFLWWLPDACSV